MCFRLPPIPMTTARLETYNVYPDIGAYGAKVGICRDRWGRQRAKDKDSRVRQERQKDKTSEDDEAIYKGNERVRFHLPVHSKLPLVFLLRLSRHPASYALPPRHLLRHSASQSGSFVLPIMVFPLHQATFTLHVMGRRNASRSMSQ
ncbi:hypothetical protein TNCV_4250431 [Trichonephila clavipes]|nr:hypothetical protein TNCV_4250431 [Trichonephila clavipes]